MIAMMMAAVLEGHALPPETISCPDGTVVVRGQPCIVRPIPPHIVYFDVDSIVLSAEARVVLDETVAAYRQLGAGNVDVAGHTDRYGSDAYNLGLGERYANAVRAYLIDNGVPSGSIITHSFGESRTQIATEDGVREPQNRRVEITITPAQTED